MDFAIRLVNTVFNLPDGPVIFFEEFSQEKSEQKSILLVKKFFGLIEI